MRAKRQARSPQEAKRIRHEQYLRYRDQTLAAGKAYREAHPDKFKAYGEKRKAARRAIPRPVKIISETKACSICRVAKFRSEFTPRRPECRLCVAAQMRVKRAARSPEEARKIRRDQYIRRRDKELATARMYRASGRQQEHTRAFYRRNPQHWRVVYARRKAENPDLFRVYGHVRRARKRNAEGFYTKEDVKSIRREQGDICAACCAPLCGAGELDHIQALFKGGSNWPHNLQFLCRPCNRRKGYRDMEVFMRAEGLI